MNGHTIRILIVDDHAVVRSGLERFLLVNKDFSLVAEAEDGAEAVQMAARYQPDVVLMDLVMPGGDGITAIREIHQKFPGVKIIALTSFSDQNLILGALQAGAIGYLQKNITAAELADAIRAVYAGRTTLSAEALAVLANASAQPPMAANELTERERDVLRAMAEGMSNNEIAEKLFISVGTVKFHISNIFQKLGINSRVEAVKLAIELKLV